MKTKIIKQEKNPHLSREEFLIQINSDITPSFEEVKKNLGLDEKLTVVKKVNTRFGEKTSFAEVFVYNSKESKDSIEVIPKKVRKKMAEEDKKRLEAERKVVAEAKKTEVKQE